MPIGEKESIPLLCADLCLQRFSFQCLLMGKSDQHGFFQNLFMIGLLVQFDDKELLTSRIVFFTWWNSGNRVLIFLMLAGNHRDINDQQRS